MLGTPSERGAWAPEGCRMGERLVPAGHLRGSALASAVTAPLKGPPVDPKTPQSGAPAARMTPRVARRPASCGSTGAAASLHCGRKRGRPHRATSHVERCVDAARHACAAVCSLVLLEQAVQGRPAGQQASRMFVWLDQGREGWHGRTREAMDSCLLRPSIHLNWTRCMLPDWPP